jgi:hypothetical protein
VNGAAGVRCVGITISSSECLRIGQTSVIEDWQQADPYLNERYQLVSPTYYRYLILIEKLQRRFKMKTSLLTFVLVISSTFAFAGQKASLKATYEALNVTASLVNPGIGGGSRLEKKIGNLSCSMTTSILAEMKTDYSCHLEQNNQPKKIYQALNTKEIAVNGGIGIASKLVKTAGPLTCSKSVSILGGSPAEYSCSL